MREDAERLDAIDHPASVTSPGWLGKVLLSFSLAGLPLALFLLRRVGRRGGMLVTARCAVLFARDLTMIVTGAPAKLRTLPRLLLFIEATTSSVATVTAAATFALHSARQAIYLSPGRGLRFSSVQGEHPDSRTMTKWYAGRSSGRV